jgi:hypothetical protein
MKNNNFVIALIFSLILGCKGDKDPKVYEVDPKIDFYINTFVAEAKKRNITIVKENLIAKFTDAATTDKGEFCGQCKQTRRLFNKNGQREININPSNLCWQAQPELVKEALIFHELGHCFLERWEHDDSKFPNNAFKSIMNSGDRGIYGPCQYAIGDVSECNFTGRREYYLDELFLEKVPMPNWAK